MLTVKLSVHGYAGAPSLPALTSSVVLQSPPRHVEGLVNRRGKVSVDAGRLGVLGQLLMTEGLLR